ncbi:hypothetical protein [Type-D symbiont of Plautia stali]|uniref:hypothetical protein n=1 Tax=Type-D symbiont of Plautia stali TaxID=1560356 RepID=UPI00128F7CDC|nr:hypothetical protein [Type-D symbiont of Plautia stali]
MALLLAFVRQQRPSGVAWLWWDFDLAAGEKHFKKSLSILLQEAKLALQKYQHPSYYTDENPYLASRVREAVYAYPRLIHAVEGKSLADWISAFPLALKTETDAAPIFFPLAFAGLRRVPCRL